MATSPLVKSPELGPHQDNLYLSFSVPELLALRDYLIAETELGELAAAASQDDPIAGAAFAMVLGRLNFVRARLLRLAPDRADLIEWCFDANTFEQGRSAAAPV